MLVFIFNCLCSVVLMTRIAEAATLTTEQSWEYGRKISLGDGHCVALKANGSVVAWGRNDHGQTNVPQWVQSGVAAVFANHTAPVVEMDNGMVNGWGELEYGTIFEPLSLPTELNGGLISIGDRNFNRTMALKKDWKLVSWRSK